MTANYGIFQGTQKVNDLSTVTDTAAARANLNVPSRWQIDPGIYAGLPGFVFTGNTSGNFATGKFCGGLFAVDRPIKVSAANVLVGTAGAAGKLARIGIFRVVPPRFGNIANDTPGTVNTRLAVDFGTVAVDSQGVKTATLGTPFTLQPGLYTGQVIHDATTVGFGAAVGISNVYVCRATNVSNTWRSFGWLWGTSSNQSSFVANGLPPSQDFVTDAATSGNTPNTVNIQFVLLNWVPA